MLDCIEEAGLATGIVLLVIMASSVVGWIVTFEQIPAAVTAWMTTYLTEPWLIILAMNVILIFLGMFIDLPAAVLLVTPIFLPLASSIGMDGVQLGVMMVVNLAMGLYTPPVGTTLFIASSVAKVPHGGRGQGDDALLRRGAPGAFPRQLRPRLHPARLIRNDRVGSAPRTQDPT